MTAEEKKRAVQEWLDAKIKAYRELGEPFNPDGDKKYWECPRCIEVHPSDRMIHVDDIDTLIEYLGAHASWTEWRDGYTEKAYNRVSFKYNGYEFFELQEVK